MGCGSPLRAFQVRPGAPVSFSPVRLARALELPCGRCAGCRLERSRQDAVRCVHEAQMHERNAFITLTYDDAHLPPGWTLVKRDWQLFMKRLRKRVGIPARFFMCGEYGEGNADPRRGPLSCGGRPHYHACLFGVDFEDRLPWKKSPSGEQIYRSALLESLWPLGFSSCGSVSFQSAAYVARYIMKKELGADVPRRRVILDVTTGEIVDRAHEFSLRSLKPGIGFDWLSKFFSDVYPGGMVVSNGVEVRAPRYYEKFFKLLYPELSFLCAVERAREMAARWDDNSPARLRVKEQVLRARVSFLKRGLE